MPSTQNVLLYGRRHGTDRHACVLPNDASVAAKQTACARSACVTRYFYKVWKTEKCNTQDNTTPTLRCNLNTPQNEPVPCCQTGPARNSDRCHQLKTKTKRKNTVDSWHSYSTHVLYLGNIQHYHKLRQPVSETLEQTHRTAHHELTFAPTHIPYHKTGCTPLRLVLASLPVSPPRRCCKPCPTQLHLCTTKAGTCRAFVSLLHTAASSLVLTLVTLGRELLLSGLAHPLPGTKLAHPLPQHGIS